MARVQWTPQQKSAIEDGGGALLVSAAAGSGKTAVLVERAVRMITRAENPVSADRLLILTFTNAAAEELRVRIGVRVEEEIRRRPGEVPLRRQRMLLRRAFIGTIDAFCQQLVKENFAWLDLPPDIAIGDASLLAQLSAEALADAMEEMYAQEDFVRFASLYGQARSDRPAEDAMLALYEFAMTLPAPAAQMDRWAAMYDSVEPLADTPWGGELLAYARQGAGAMAGMLRQAAAIAGAEPDLAPYLPALLEEQGAAARLAEAAAHGDWDEAVAALHAVQFGRLAPVRGYEGTQKEQVKTLRDGAKDIADRLGRYCLACTGAEYEADRRQAAPLVGELCRAAALYGEKYRAAKLEEKVLDFADFEQLALALLRDEEGNRTPMAERVSGRYDAVMVDEYQDTNELQSALYESLALPGGGNLFYVGDVKQSIYRFRKADPGIFLAKKDVWAAYDAATYPAALELAHNFRSGRGVVAGVNYLFSTLMSRQVGEVEYGEGERLIQGGEGGEEEGLELRIVRDPEGAGDAEYVAGRIGQMLTEGYRVRGKEGPRRCGPGDFCILLRARARVPQYVQALAARGIPVAAAGGEDLLQTPEVLPVVAALAVIDNPGDDVMLASALLGPLFGFTADEVTALRALAPRGSLWGAVSASEDEKAKSFVQSIGFYRALAGEMGAGRLCEELLSRTGYLSAVAAMEGGGARRENLLRFLGWIGEVSAMGRGGLAGVVRLLREGRGPAAAAAAAVPGRVNILTVHKSKGLEFPVCFLADAAHVFNASDLTARVQLHQKLGVGLALRAGHTLYATAPALAVRRRIEREALSEEMRVLYVALTRAKEKVIVTFAHKDPERYLAGKAAALCGAAPGAYLLGSQRSLADWVTLAALCHPDAGPLVCHCGGAMLPVLPAEGRFVMGVEAQPPAASAEGAYALTAAPDDALAGGIAAGFEESFARAALAAVPVKLSVSEMAKPTAAPVRRRPSILYAAGLTAAERGTAQHAFMQYADPAAAAQDVEAEIERLVAGGYLRAEAAAALDRKGIRAFLASPLAQRMGQAAQVLREYDFITALPAGQVQPGLPAALAEEAVMVQGIADMVLVYEDHAEIVDYKTDHGKGAEELAAGYAAQLHLYKDAIEKRLAVPVTRLTIWAFELGREIDIT